MNNKLIRCGSYVLAKNIVNFSISTAIVSKKNNSNQISLEF